MSPVLKQKPVLDPKPPCGGCDVCGDLREDALYLLGYTGKYYCHSCFDKVSQNWPKRDKSKINETTEQRANEALMLENLKVYLGEQYTVEQTERLSILDGMIYKAGVIVGAVEAKGRPSMTLHALNTTVTSWGDGPGLFVEQLKIDTLFTYKSGAVIAYNLKGDDKAYIMSREYVREHGTPGRMNRTVSDRGQNDKDRGLYVVIPKDAKTFQWRADL